MGQPAKVLSLFRPGELPLTAPSGQAAKALRWDSYVDHPGAGAAIADLVAVFRQAEAGFPQRQCDLFDDLIEFDGTLRNLFEQREGAIAGKPWLIAARGADADSMLAADILNQALEQLPLVDVLTHQLGANRYGYAGSEIDWIVKQFNGRDFVVPGWFANVPPRRFRIDLTTDELLLLTEQTRFTGERLAPGKWWVTRLAACRVARAGLMRTAAPYALIKKHGVVDWSSYSEMFGIPQVTLIIPENASDKVKDVALEWAESYGSDKAVVLEKPVDGTIESKTEAAPVADSSGTHGSLITFCNREMAKLINGSVLTNDNADSGGASYALGEVHAATRWETVLRDYARLQETFRRCVAAPFMQFNRLEGRPPALNVQVVRELEPDKQMKLAQDLIDAGGEVSLSQVRGFTGLHKPLDGNDVLKKAPAAPAAPGPQPATPTPPEAP